MLYAVAVDEEDNFYTRKNKKWNAKRKKNLTAVLSKKTHLIQNQ